ncbi:MAG TPA: hypothetical protein ENI86_03810 [Acidimicrobiales bacterium]|nr:hypothetical protein [Acidimicrobiales bacterium]
MGEHAAEFDEAGVAVVSVGGSAEYQARDLAGRGHPFPVLLDPDQILRSAVGFGDLSKLDMLKPEGARNYWRSFRRGARQGRPTRDRERSPGIVVLDSRQRPVWAREGRALGDYPAVGEVLAEVRRLTERGDLR